jgi:hypothetical protein
VVAQDDNTVSSFRLQYHATSGRWAAVAGDQNNPSSVLLTSGETAALGEWTHLALVYDANLDQLRLYVNGRLSAAQVGVVTWNAGGKLSVGRAKTSGGNVDYFAGGIDDVRTYSRALSTAEVGKVYDDVSASSYGFWRFDDQTVRDYSSRNSQTTASGPVSYGAGVSGQALVLDGVSGSAAAQTWSVSTRDSLTVSAWVKMTRKDRVQTVLGQDGTRKSGFVLQYRPNLDRWVFAAPTADSDGAELVYASSAQAAAVNQWVHLAGVYDHGAEQLRLYVNGDLVGSRNGVTLWAAMGGFTIGRGKVNGQPAEYLAGTVDEVRAEQGMVTDNELSRRASWPTPPLGQVGRYVNARGDRASFATASAPAEHHLDRSLGMLVADGEPNTRMLYACLYGTDAFTSIDPDCEGQVKVGDIGRLFTQAPTTVPGVPVYRCNSGPDHFESNLAACEGATQEMLLGYAVGYAPLARYNYPAAGDHWVTSHGTPPGYGYEDTLGYLSVVSEPGTQQLMSCRDGVDQFNSVDPNCDGKQILGGLGNLWTAPPPGVASQAIYRCMVGTERFTSRFANCEGTTFDRQLGYVLATPPPVSSASP